MSLPQNFDEGDDTAVVGTDIYLFGMTSYTYKYDTLTNTYTVKTNAIGYSGGSTVGIGTKIYIVQNYFSKNIYIYDTIKDSSSRIKDIPTEWLEGDLIVIDTNLYLLYNSKIFKLNRKNNYIYTIVGTTYKAQLTKLLSTYFSNAYIYDNDELQEYSCYYGDGTRWNLIS